MQWRQKEINGGFNRGYTNRAIHQSWRHPTIHGYRNEQERNAN